MANNLRLSPYYWKYDGVQVEGELRLPINSTPSAPSLGPGSTRWNPTTGINEIWNGTEWTAIKASNGGIIVLKDFYTNVSNTPDSGSNFIPLYTYDIPANTFDTDGQKLIAKFSGSFNNNSLKSIAVFFNGINIGAINNITTITKWNSEVLIIRTGTNSAKSYGGFSLQNNAGLYNHTNLDFHSIITLEISALTNSGVTGDVIAEMGTIYLLPPGQ